ncbi:MAG: hypothetical protein U0936_10795 [Planctomycetaceae bacterium]
MLKDRSRIERQLTKAQQQLSACETKLASEGVTGKARGKNAVWRSLNADYRQLKRRLNAVAALEAREAGVIQRKAEKAAAAEAVEA